MLHFADSALRRIGVRSEELAWTLLHSVGCDTATLVRVRALNKDAGLEGDDLERLLIWHASQQALLRVPSLPVANAVRRRLDQDLRQLHSLNASMAAGSYHFDRAAKMATLRRFSAGPMEWEIGGIPCSWFLNGKFSANLQLLAFVTFRVKGRLPYFSMHVAPAPRNRALRVPAEVLRAYYRMARSMQLQPNVLALMAKAWFHDPAAVRDYPHLEVLNRPYVAYGGLIVLHGLAESSSGVLEGNAQRRADYLAGKVRYREGLAIWPRDAVLRWADVHPELED